MSHQIYSCLCCNPMSAELFKNNQTVTELAEQWAASGHATNWFQSGAHINRRDFVRGGAAFACTAPLMPAAAHAQEAKTRVFEQPRSIGPM